MTKEFAEMIDSLARARNFEDGSFLLLTAEPGADKAKIEMKGEHSALVAGMGTALNHILSEVDNKEALEVREYIKKIIIDDEVRRFQDNETSEYEDSIELKPCPECGGEAETVIRRANGTMDKYIIKCMDCGAATSPPTFSKKAAIEIWNTVAE